MYNKYNIKKLNEMNEKIELYLASGLRMWSKSVETSLRPTHRAGGGQNR